MVMLRTPQNTIATSSVSARPQMTEKPELSAPSPILLAATENEIQLPSMNTSPWAKLISSRIP